MKHISAFFDQVEKVEERFAWWPIRSTFSKKLIWFKKYTVVRIYYDDMGRPPIKERSWDLVYTQNEYMLHLLRKDNSAVR